MRFWEKTGRESPRCKTNYKSPEVQKLLQTPDKFKGEDLGVAGVQELQNRHARVVGRGSVVQTG
jgi:hypothetical protein